jgi:hypothetical protein
MHRHVPEVHGLDLRLPLAVRVELGTGNVRTFVPRSRRSSLAMLAADQWGHAHILNASDICPATWQQVTV